jgi:hypothetical protein
LVRGGRLRPPPPSDGSEVQGIDHLFLCQVDEAERRLPFTECAGLGECRWVPPARHPDYTTVLEAPDLIAEAVRTVRLCFD